MPLGAVVGAVARHPSLWFTAAIQVVRLARPGWWRGGSHLPVPAGPYLAFRLETMYGGDGGSARPDDVVTWLQWCRSVRRALR